MVSIHKPHLRVLTFDCSTKIDEFYVGDLASESLSAMKVD